MVSRVPEKSLLHHQSSLQILRSLQSHQPGLCGMPRIQRMYLHFGGQRFAKSRTVSCRLAVPTELLIRHLLHN